MPADRSTAMLRPPRRAAAAALCCLAALFGAGGAAAQGTIDREAQRTYQSEAAACRGGTWQDRSACMREAGAAREETRRGRFADRGSDYSKNAAQRCNGLPEADRKDCLMRVQGQGQGKASGSVEGGGIYRETVTRTPAPRTPEPVPPPKVTDTTPGTPQN